GLVLASAGYSGVMNGELTSAELYDPTAGAWAPTGDLATPRRVHTATLLPSGQVLVTGGLPADGGPATSSAELYDPVSGLWTATGPLMMARFTHTATLLSSGQVLVSGGRTKDALDGVTLSSVELSVDDGTNSPPKGASSGPTGLRRRP
ncbi:MAG TPA: kelch repeat-containing protein, partial [Vicinamibacterales bacterium]